MSDRNDLPPDAETTPAAENPPRIYRVKGGRGRFGPGNPGAPFPDGNPGRPKGARNKATTVLKSIFAGEAEEIGRRVVELAKEGRVTAAKLVLDHACPVRRGATLDGLDLPPIATATDALAAMSAVATAVTAGKVAIDEAREFAAFIESFCKIHEFADIERRLVKLEKAKANAPS